MRSTGWVLASVVLGCGPSDEKVCDWFVADATACYDSYCDDEGAGTSFCECWDDGQDLDITSCECTTLTLDLACDVLNLEDYREGDFNCSAATAALSDTCDG